MQRIDNLSKWTLVPVGDMMCLPHRKKRNVKLHVNAPAECRLYLALPGSTPIFLALIKGRDTIVFTLEGEAELSCDADLWLHTSENETIHAANVGSKFTKIMERQPRNLEFERMQYHMMQNVNRRLDKQASEYEAKLQEQRNETAAIKKAASESGEPAKKLAEEKKPAADPEPEENGAGEKKPDAKDAKKSA